VLPPTRRFLRLLALATLVRGAVPALAQPAVTLAIRHVTVLTGMEPPAPDRTVLVAGNRIMAITAGAGATVPPGATTIDGAGKFLIPGLWDLHTHVTMFGRPALALLLANGVTGIRDMGAERFAVAKALRDSIAAGRIQGPRMRIASPVVENPRWLAAVKRMIEQAHTPWTLYERFGPESAAEAEHWVDSVVALGADHIKVRNWPSLEIGRALVARAKMRGIPVVGHANEPFPRVGVTSFEHGIWPPLERSAAARDSLWRTFVAEGTAFDPTLVTGIIRSAPPDTLLAHLADGRIANTRYVPAPALQAWRNQLTELKQESGGVDWAANRRAGLRDLGEMHRAGVTVVAGTDLGAPLVVPGFSLHDELAQLVSAGFTPTEALAAATVQATRVLRLADSLGSVRAGQVADLVLLDADPRADIAATRRIAGVIVNGRWLDRKALDGMLVTVAAEAGSR
jgi:imidazolonepropionase-like amidohydrolase